MMNPKKTEFVENGLMTAIGAAFILSWAFFFHHYAQQKENKNDASRGR